MTHKRLGEGEDMAKSIKAVTEIVASNSNAIVDFVTAYKKGLESDDAVDRTCSVKLQQLIDTLGSSTDLKTVKPPAKTVIVKTVADTGTMPLVRGWHRG